MNEDEIERLLREIDEREGQDRAEDDLPDNGEGEE
jgi:hypothetical protein